MKPFALYYQGTPKQRGEDYLPNVIRVNSIGGCGLLIAARNEVEALAKAKSGFPILLASKLMVQEVS